MPRVAAIRRQALDQPLLQPGLALEEAADDSRGGRISGRDVEVAVEVGAVQRDQQRRIASEGQRHHAPLAPDRGMLPDVELTERMWPAGGRIECRRLLPDQPAEIMLLRAQAYVLERRDEPEVAVAPGPHRLSGQPCVAWLRNGDDRVTEFAKQHAADLVVRPLQ